MPQKRMVAAAALIGVMVLVGGFFSYQVFINKSNGSHSESIPIGGYVVIKAYHANGQLYATWQGHNSLNPFSLNAIADCMSGVSNTPEEFGTCSPLTTNVWVAGPEVNPPNTQQDFNAVATNTLLPSGCITSSTTVLPTCTGWQTTGTITFSGSNLPISVNTGGTDGGGTAVVFDQVPISPSITVNAGDSLVVTVTFSIT